MSALAPIHRRPHDEAALRACVEGSCDDWLAASDARYRAALRATEDGTDPLALVRMTGASWSYAEVKA